MDFPDAVEPVSPCIEVCEADSAGVCRGCFRTLDEIAQWPSMTNEQKWRVLATVQARRKESTRGP
ncbi:MAG: DUF1289 domain-containing protein [Gammaproteobacteria bacterium]